MPILARWTKAFLFLFLVTLAQHWANVEVPHETTAGLTLAHLWYLMLDLHWSNAGLMKVSQRCTMLARWTKLRWPNIGCQRWANVSAYIGSALAQCWCAIWAVFTRASVTGKPYLSAVPLSSPTTGYLTGRRCFIPTILLQREFK